MMLNTASILRFTCFSDTDKIKASLLKIQQLAEARRWENRGSKKNYYVLHTLDYLSPINVIIMYNTQVLIKIKILKIQQLAGRGGAHL